MPVQTSYPGVYVQEVPSGVRTITGVSTSIAAFVGTARRGPINRAIPITSYADYERRFGGLSTSSEMSYAVRQFFLNGGTQAIITRVASNAVAASRQLLTQGPAPVNALLISAFDQGSEGNRIEVKIDYQSANPNSLFNLVINYSTVDNPSQVQTETHPNLSMNSFHPRYVEQIVNTTSSLVRVSRNVPAATLAALVSGTTMSGILTDVQTLLDATHNRLRISVNGLDAVNVQINLPADVAGANPAARLATLCAAITASVQLQANGELALSSFLASAIGGNQIKMVSGLPGEKSRVQVLSGLGNDAASRLQLGLNSGAVEIDSVSAIMPSEIPNRATLTSGNIAAADITGAPALPTVDHRFRISIDGSFPGLIDLPVTALAGAAVDRLGQLATMIQSSVRASRPSSIGFRDFTCTVVGAAAPFKLLFAAGSRGSNSSIVVSAEPGDAFVTRLKLLVDGSGTTAVITQPVDIMLQGGTEMPVTTLNMYEVYTGSQALRTGIYALESSDIFNILCLPGITDSGILSECEAYCRTRRAFMIVDSPQSSKIPEQMATTIAGTALPKSDHAAVYYPWIKISDPLNGGQLRITPPGGTLAGLYARTDASRGIWKAPAGTEAVLNGVRELEYVLTDRENGMLNPLGVDCLRIFPESGAVSWGGRTLAGSDSNASEWKYIPVRRTALYIEESLYRGLKWVVFEPNDEPLWAQIRLNVGAFMHNLFRQGAFQGIKKTDAYFVKCDSETTTQNDINLGIVNIWVGFAPLKPAEFVVLYLQQVAGNILV